MWVTDQERKVKLLEDFYWHDGRVSGLGLRLVWIWSCVSIGNAICNFCYVLAYDFVYFICQEMLTGAILLQRLSSKRGCDAGMFSLRRHEIMCDVFNEQAFSLDGARSADARSLDALCSVVRSRQVAR